MTRRSYTAGLALACFAAQGACFFDHAGLSGESADSGETPDVAVGPDADGDGGGGPDARPDVEVCVQECVDSSTLFDCSSGMQRKCDLGCMSGPPARCADMVPSNFFDRGWLGAATATLTVPAGETWVFDTDTGEVTTCSGLDVRPAGLGVVNQIVFEIIPAPAMGSAIGVFTLTSLTVEAGATVRGVGTAAMGLYAADTVEIRGMIAVPGGARSCDAAAACDMFSTGDRKCGGPGGYGGGLTIAAGFGPGGGDAGAGGESTTIERGGGGGGFQGIGGLGGGVGGSGGPSYGAVEPLVGGSGGGGGGSDSVSNGGWGGGGGGAIRITARTSITITEAFAGTPAGVWAGGAGGGYATGTGGGGGGGSGGGILLESPVIQIEFGRVAANGGGGGGTPGTSGAGALPTEGETGTFGTAGAAGGGGGNIGGSGGALVTPNGGGGVPFPVAGDAGSGGGGGAGRVTIKTLNPTSLITSTPQISPAATTTTITIQ